MLVIGLFCLYRLDAVSNDQYPHSFPETHSRLQSLGEFTFLIFIELQLLLQFVFYSRDSFFHIYFFFPVDLIMWKDVSRSVFMFGIGTFVILSSSYMKDLHIR